MIKVYAGARESKADMEDNCREWKLTTVEPQERSTWRLGVRPALRAASQLTGEDTLMWMIVLHLHVNQKSDYDYRIMILTNGLIL